MRNKVLIIAVILTLGSVILVVLSGQKVAKQQEELNVERYKRMVAEEKLGQLRLKVKSFESQLAQKHTRLEDIQSLLEKERESANNLKKQMEEMLKTNKEIMRNPVPAKSSTLPAGSAK